MSTTFWIQFIGILFGLTMLYMTFLKLKRKEISGNESAFWFLGWTSFITLSISPKILDPIIKTLNFSRRIDFFVVLGFFVLLGLGFYNYSQVKKMEQKL
ncbi:MAG: DUF2304 domain-containing protein, partial [Nanoarchaeota archaeon]|nr:DUF2304 domain-containing protein [Nanoarchaeota archaeon]